MLNLYENTKDVIYDIDSALSQVRLFVSSVKKNVTINWEIIDKTNVDELLEVLSEINVYLNNVVLPYAYAKDCEQNKV